MKIRRIISVVALVALVCLVIRNTEFQSYPGFGYYEYHSNTNFNVGVNFQIHAFASNRKGFSAYAQFAVMNK